MFRTSWVAELLLIGTLRADEFFSLQPDFHGPFGNLFLNARTNVSTITQLTKKISFRPFGFTSYGKSWVRLCQ